MKRLSLILCAGFALFCSETSLPISQPIVVTVQDAIGDPVPQAAVSLDGEVRGSTDEMGRFQGSLPGPEGRRARVAVECPSGMVPKGAYTLELSIRFLRSIASKSGAPVPEEVDFRCVSATRQIVLLVETDGGQGLPVTALGRRIATVNEDGVAQTVLAGLPGQELEVCIDTTSMPDIRPVMPTRRFVIPEESQIIVFSQKFERKKKKTRKGNRRKPRTMRPRRI